MCICIKDFYCQKNIVNKLNKNINYNKILLNFKKYLL